MASVTMELREIVEHYTQFETVPLSIAEKIEIARPKIFNFEYPIFDTSYKKIFETNFIRHFYMKEIGFETEGLFKFQLETWLNIHMPYFNKLFESELIEFNPLHNTELDSTYKKENERDTKEDTTGTRTDGRTIDFDKQTSDKQDDLRNINTDENVKSDTNSKGNVKSTDDTTTTNNRDRETSSNATTTNDDFNRHLESEMPDQRLGLTANDGEGLLNYASKITEDTDNRSQKENSSGDESTTDKGTSKSNQNADVTNNENTSIDTDRTTQDDYTSNKNGTEASTTKDNLNRNDRGNRTENINGIEDYVEHKVGKIGTDSYSKMLTEFRDTFLRIERDIFWEMRDLFLLLYL